MIWHNYFVSSLKSFLTEGHFTSEELRAKIEAHSGAEAYHCAYDLEKRDDYKSYAGLLKPAFDFVWVDFDSLDNPQAALDDVRRFIKKFPASQFLAYSGKKGFHIGVPFSAFGLAPRADLEKILKAWAQNAAKEFPTLDTSVYNANRKFRALGTKHPKTGLYKKSLDIAKIDSLTIDDIRADCALRGEVSMPFANTVPVDPNITAWLIEPAPAAKASPKNTGAERDPYWQQFENFNDKKCISSLLNKIAREGERHKISLILASDFYRTGTPYAKALKKIHAWATLNNVTSRIPEFETHLNDAYSEKDNYSFGCVDGIKAANCTAKCKLYRGLSPDKRPKAIDAPISLKAADALAKKPRQSDVAKAFLTKYEGNIVKQRGILFKYVGTHWEEINKDQECALRTSLWEAQGCFGSHNESKQLLEAFRDLVPWVPEKHNLFQSDPYAVNFLNGTLHLIREENRWKKVFLPHAKTDFLINVLPFNYPENYDTSHPDLDLAFDNLFAGAENKADLLSLLSELFGACLAPAFPKVFFIVGIPGTGKSQIIILASHMLSEQNICRVPPNELAGFDTETMAGKLLNAVTDIDVSKPLADSKIKQIIDRVPVRIKRKGIKDVYAPLPAVHIFGTNRMPPTLEGESEAHNRRIIIFEFKKVLLGEKGEYDPNFADKLFAKAGPAVLNFALRGLDRLLEHNGMYTKTIASQDAVNEWRGKSDVAQQFIEAVDAKEIFGYEDNQAVLLRRTKKYDIPRTQLYEIFVKWCESVGYQSWNAPKAHVFYDALKAKGFEFCKIKDVRSVVGLTVGHGDESDF